MFIVTNRQLIEEASGMDQLGPRPNEKGSNELRVVEANRKGKRWTISILPDELTAELKKKADIKDKDTLYASHYAAAMVLKQARRQKKNLLFFVHGYNNDINVILNRAADLEQTYGVIVVCFSWPARGGGVRGTLSYRQDKRDAKASIGAFERFLIIARTRLDSLNEHAKDEAIKKAEKKHPENNEARDAEFQKLMDRSCPVRINLMLHSMGNYLLKHTVLSSTSNEIGTLFDNVALVAADTNNEGHKLWVDKIRAREAIYVVINENDIALRASETKIGEAQRARLGRLRRRLDSEQAVYVDVTDVPYVSSSHSYFEGRPVSRKKSELRMFFDNILNGKRGEDRLVFDSGIGAYRISDPDSQADRPNARISGIPVS